MTRTKGTVALWCRHGWVSGTVSGQHRRPHGLLGRRREGGDLDTGAAQMLDDSNPPFYRWFPDGELNTCANALDRHVEAGAATSRR